MTLDNGRSLREARPLSATLADKFRRALPQGRLLPEDVWQSRHRGMVVLLWLHAAGLAAFGLVVGRGLRQSLAAGAILMLAALVAGRIKLGRQFRAITATLGLLTASGILVHLSGGYIEMHFHYFVMVGVLMLYQDWKPFLVAILYVVAQHGLMGSLAPHHVYNHAGAWTHPWHWAAVHGVFILGMSAVNLVNWRLAERQALQLLERLRLEGDLRQALKGQETFLRHVLDTNPQLVFVKDREGRFMLANQAVASMYGTTVEELVGRTDADFNSNPEEVEAFLRDDREVMTGGRRKFITAEPVTDAKTGEVRWFQTTKVPLASPTDGARHVLGVATDITDLKRAEEALRESEERYALAARGANDGLWDWDLRAGVIYFSPRWKSMLGCEEHEIGCGLEEWLGRLHMDDSPRVRAALNSHLAGMTSSFEAEYRIRHQDGSYAWMLSRGIAVRDATGAATRMAGSQTDITMRKKAEEQLLHDALHDALTGLPNRALMMDRIACALGRARRRPECSMAALFLDLDRFKVINDSLGHMLGDQLLIEIGRRLQACVRPGDTVARLGGDEFTILLEPLTGEEGATSVTTRIQRELSRPFQLGGQEVYTTASIGIALGGGDYADPEELLRDADAAMYRAKALGGSQHQVFDSSMRAAAVALLNLEVDLRRALERRELRLHYQPIVSLQARTITGFEALVRWEHPQVGLIPPGEFIPLAEETGLIVPLGQWVLREACRRAAAWQACFPSDPPMTISVNLCSRQLMHPDVVLMVEEALSESGLDPRSLRLEITESAIIENTDQARTTLSRLKEMGIQLHMDDFGTGYSSLSYLHRFPVDALKIDRYFIGRITSRGENLEIVRTIVQLARSLGIETVAEGLETEVQLARLRELGCELGQGFLISEPLDEDAATALVASAHDRADVEMVAV